FAAHATSASATTTTIPPVCGRRRSIWRRRGTRRPAGGVLGRCESRAWSGVRAGGPALEGHSRLSPSVRDEGGSAGSPAPGPVSRGLSAPWPYHGGEISRKSPEKVTAGQMSAASLSSVLPLNTAPRAEAPE